MKRFGLLWLCCFPALAAGAVWQEPDDTTSLLQLSFANQQVNQRNAKRPNKGRREDMNVAEQNQMAPTINLAKMATLVSDVERRHAVGDVPSGTDDGATSGSSDAEGSTSTGPTTSAGGSWSADEKTALETLKSALENQFTPFLDAEHGADIREYEARKAVHQLCMTHNVEDTNAVAAAQASTLETADKHRACRKSQKSWNDYRSLALSESSCAEASDIPLMHEIYDNHEELVNSMQAAKMHAQTYANLAPAGVKRDCAQDQQAYEEQWCAWVAYKDDTCTQLKRCLDTVALGSLNSDIETRAGNRRMIWDTVIKLQCRIEHLLSTFTGTEEAPSASDTSDDISNFNTDDTCSEVTDTSKYVLSLDVPQQVSCSDAGEAADDAITPGGSACSDWIARRFSAGQGWSPTTHVVPATCQASCATRTITAAPALHEGCVEDPAGCAFYNAHPDACGKYDTGSVVQSADCCACAPLPCDAIVDCSGHGATFDLDNTDGCHCACDEGFEGADCATSSVPGEVTPISPFFDQTITCQSIWDTRRAEACPSPSAPPGWVRILEYQDDECKDDIPTSPTWNNDPMADADGIEPWKAGFATTNAAFVGSEHLSALIATGAYTRGALCFKSSRSDCHGGCSEFDASTCTMRYKDIYWSSNTNHQPPWGRSICGEFGDNNDLEKAVLTLAGACVHKEAHGSSPILQTSGFSWPLGSDGKKLLDCDRSGVEWDSRGFLIQQDVQWKSRGYGLTLKTGDISKWGLFPGDELAPIAAKRGHSWNTCPIGSADVDGGVDSMWLYLGTPDAASMATA